LRLKNPKTHKRYKVKFIVVDDKYTPLLGAKSIQAMNLIKIQFQNIMVCDNSHNTADISTMKSIVSEYSDIFEGVSLLLLGSKPSLGVTTGLITPSFSSLCSSFFNFGLSAIGIHLNGDFTGDMDSSISNFSDP
jgi:hypothetical protein